MSQRRDTMPVIQREGGIGDRLLRPLCAQLLPETLPEKEGWVDREQMFGFSGRSRKPQIELATRLGFDEWSQPAGGCCFLTDQSYSAKLADLWRARGEKTYELDDIMLLKIGRHLRPRPHFKLIVSREEGENNFLRGYRKQFSYFDVTSHPGPLTLVDGSLDETDIELAAAIVGRFSQGRDAPQITLTYVPLGGEQRQLQVQPFAPDQIDQHWYI
jgi:tRNA U34 2-thiouridine synthase MnmA/TrmU